MEIIPTEIPEVRRVRPRRFGDDRGFFSETFRSEWFPGIDFVQDNHSLSAEQGTVRGLHFQTPPFAQDKLVRVARGRILDVAVDIRVGSPTFGEHVTVELSADNWEQLLVPRGFAHGFVTLEPNSEVLYKTSDVYSSEHDAGIRWNDPTLHIAWDVEEGAVSLSERDAGLPLLADLPDHFRYEGDG